MSNTTKDETYSVYEVQPVCQTLYVVVCDQTEEIVRGSFEDWDDATEAATKLNRSSRRS